MAVSPLTLRGAGANTTGGGQSASSHVIFVTSLSDSAATANSIRWALDRHPGDPLYICLAVEGEIALASQLTITRPNITIDGRFAPGVGCWFTGERNKVLFSQAAKTAPRAKGKSKVVGFMLQRLT